MPNTDGCARRAAMAPQTIITNASGIPSATDTAALLPIAAAVVAMQTDVMTAPAHSVADLEASLSRLRPPAVNAISARTTTRPTAREVATPKPVFTAIISSHPVAIATTANTPTKATSVSAAIRRFDRAVSSGAWSESDIPELIIQSGRGHFRLIQIPEITVEILEDCHRPVTRFLRRTHEFYAFGFVVLVVPPEV